MSTWWRRQSIWKIVTYARLAETYGFQHLWTSDESYMGEKDAFVLLSAISAETKTIKLGPYGANPYIREPASLAATLTTLNELSGGRAIIALGRGSTYPLTNLGIEQRKPLTKLKETVEVVKKLTTGERVIYKGKTVTVGGLKILAAKGEPIPVYVATCGPKTLEMAGAVADGVMMVTVPTGYVEYAKERIKEGARSANKDIKGFDIATACPCFISEDYDEAYKEAKRFAAFIALVPSIIPVVLEKAGFTAKQIELLKGHPDRLHAWYSKEQKTPEEDGKRPELIVEDVIDKIITELAIVGTPEDCIKRIRSYEEKGLTQIVLAPWTSDVPGWLRMIGTQVLPAFNK
ncbi:MAG: LLM class flavin-dependent oxidoreductase [Candidatus Bathyarchaeia archaeon]